MRQLLFCCILLCSTAVFAQKEQPTEFQVQQPNVAALRQSLDDLREARKQGFSTPVEIALPSGRYEFLEPLKLDPELVADGLTLKAKEAREAVFSGGVSLTSKGKDDQGRWRYALPEDWQSEVQPRVIVIDEELRSPARYPNEGYFRIEKALEDRRSGFSVNADDVPSKGLPGSGCDLILMHDWSSSRLPVASFDGSSRVLKTVGPIGCSAPHYAIDHFEKQPRYYLEGHAQFADVAGEWYVDNEAREIVLLSGSEDKAPAVVLPRLTTILSAAGDGDSPVRGLVVSGITFTETAFPMPAGGLAGAQATMHEPRDASGKRTTGNRPMLPAGVTLENAKRCRFLGCRFENMGTTALWLSSRVSDCVVQRCVVTSVGGNGINMGEDNARRIENRSWYQAAPDQVPSRNTIDQCEISLCGRVLPGAVGIWAPLNNELRITNNNIHDCPYTGISLGWIWNPSPSPAGKNLISGNRIQYVMQTLSDGGGIYTLGYQPGSVIEKNIITDVPLNAGRAESNGMFLDEGSSGFTIRENTIRRIDRSPLRFHKAGENLAENNSWELATAETPPVRFNNTPEKNITVRNNTVLEEQQRIYLIGNSLTWDTVPSRLDEGVEWHVDCGKNLQYIRDNPSDPCVSTSRIWPRALRSAQYDLISFQIHYGSTLEEDLAVISMWLEMQPKAVVLLHTGWPRHAELTAGIEPKNPEFTHTDVYFNALLERLRNEFPEREFRCTWAMNLVRKVQADIKAGDAPFKSIDELYRDAIHMTTDDGRYLMHNRMRQTMGQPLSSEGYEELDPERKTYLDGILEEFGESDKSPAR